MSHIKKFEATSDIFENYFKDKINWKFYNYLLDKATEFEDAGRFVVIVVSVCDDFHSPVYAVLVKNMKFFDGDKDTIKAYNKYGLVYMIYIYSDKECNDKNLEAMDYYLDRIKDKCSYWVKNDVRILVEPK